MSNIFASELDPGDKVVEVSGRQNAWLATVVEVLGETVIIHDEFDNKERSVTADRLMYLNSADYQNGVKR